MVDSGSALSSKKLLFSDNGQGTEKGAKVKD
jgi:hypothetical protein